MSVNEPSSIRILIVDDESDIRTSLLAFFEDEGLRVRAVATAQDALAEMKQKSVDIAIVDIRLPEMDGHALILRAHELSPETRFLIHTGSVNYRLPDALMSIGMSMNDVFRKPVASLNVLTGAVRRVALEKEKSHVRH